MAIEVTLEAVKAKCRILDDEYDDEILALIEEQVPAIEFAILPEHLSSLFVASTLDLGATEIVAGEFLAQSFREPGVAEEIQVGELRIGDRLPPGAKIDDPYMLKEQGWKRLSPYLKAVEPLQRKARTTHISATPELAQ